MNALLVVERELRAESRRAANFWLRLLAAGTVILVFAGLAYGWDIPAAQLGSVLFSVLHQTMSLTFWIVVPLMTADCVSRERREGTLSLLFLTPLTPFDVIVGKGVLHALRAVTLFIAALPVLGLPLVLGGVEWPTVLMATLQEACIVLLGISTGLYASTRAGSAIQAMVLAEAYGFGLALVTAACDLTLESVPPRFYRFSVGLLLLIAVNVALKLLVFRLVLRASIKRLQRTWQEELAAPEQPQWVQVLATWDFWQAAFRWDKTGTLKRNPIAWLQEYSWTARLTKWGWCLGLLVVQFFVLINWDPDRFVGWEPTLIAALALGVAFSAAGSFRRERQTGLLELLLVTPLSVGQLIRGRLWGVCCHYFPAFAVLLVCWAGDRALNARIYESGIARFVLPNPVAFGFVMMLGLCFSVGRVNFILASAFTWVIGFLAPIQISALLVEFKSFPLTTATMLVSVVQVALGTFIWFLLYQNLRRRAFL